MKKVTKLLPALLLAPLLTVPVANHASADDCPGMYQVRGDVWHEDFRNHLVTELGGPVVDVIHGKATLIYRYCPQGDLPNKMLPVRIRWEFRDIDRHFLFQGLRVEGWVYELDTGEAVIPGDFWIPDPGSGDSTVDVTQNIPIDKRKWLQFKDDIRWAAYVKMVNKNWIDSAGWFLTADQERLNQVLPGADSTLILSRWISG